VVGIASFVLFFLVGSSADLSALRTELADEKAGPSYF
jgi:hypothetical protein